ncbi:hypothetical protein NW063_03870 [Mycoplasmopsis cynos]|uniref:hypothetical protein n=1 Tax=Mycoplasmopsis cynos TaxID=171284 RepID=UPI0021FEB3E2|nr:hypothetical protein [Mycoplasmopsis cynos]UWV85971.1 hypothetical protein NW063_03870 [Mycoplasmopsis cynos]
MKFQIRNPRYEPIATPIIVCNVATIKANLIALQVPIQLWVQISIPTLFVPKNVLKWIWGFAANISL